MKLALVTTDVREHVKDYGNSVATFGAAPEALLCGLAQLPQIEVHVLSCSRQPMKSQEKLAPNIWFHSLWVPRLGWMRTLYQGCIRAVRRKLNQLRPDIVHGQGSELDCALDAVYSGFPNVVTLHGNMAEMARIGQARKGSFHWLAGHLETWALKRTAGVFCNSRHTQQQVGSRARRTWIVPNALRPEFLVPAGVRARQPVCRLLHIGAVCPNKQQLATLEVVGRLHREGLAFEIHFLGAADPRDPYSARFLTAVQAAEREGYARYLGTRPVQSLVEFFDGASALVHTPRAEAFGLVVAEALVRGLQFFGFRVGGVRDIVEGVDGARLVEPDDWPGLEVQLREWLRVGHPAPAPAAGLMAQRYAPAVVAQRHLEIYEEVLSRGW